jgi:hypothetical protein
LPTDTTFLQNDVNGATLFIIYSDSLANFGGTMNINDGFVLIKNDTVLQTIKNLNVPNTTPGKAFMIVSDFQNVPGNTLKMNNGAFLGVVQDFWDYEERNTAYIASQTTSTFGVASPNDCSNLITIGTYYQTPYNLTAPVASQILDTLYSTAAATYQWALNDIAIPGATSSSYIAKRSGNYSVVVSYSTSICYIASTVIPVITCQDKIEPNISFAFDSLWTDSTNYKLQWYYNGSPITNATDSVYKALLPGNYWVQARDTITGCIAYSDTIFISLIGINEIANGDIRAAILPNPNSGSFLLDLTYVISQDLEISVMNLQGQKIFNNRISLLSNENNKQIHFDQFSSGVYILKIASTNSVTTKKLVVTRE